MRCPGILEKLCPPGPFGFIFLWVLLFWFFPVDSFPKRFNAVSAQSGSIRTAAEVRSYHRPSQPAGGVFLIAEPHLSDPHFSRTVVLIIKHSSNGSLGIIINRPTERPLKDIWPELKNVFGKEDLLFIGGPVQHDSFGMLYLGDRAKNNHPPVFENVFYSNNPAHLKPIAKGEAGGATGFRVFAGYAGWAPGQLQSEIQRGDWRLADGYADAIFQADPGNIWSELLADSEKEWIRAPGVSPPGSPLARTSKLLY